MPQSRQLAAIMFTDIVGYTALMGNDEQKAFELLNKNRQIQKPIIEQYNGRWIKELGDGVMASFNTVSDSVNAAIKIQEACNTAKDFQLKIGIHLGEVVFENDDVFGDGVNIASRIESLGIPGAILMSKTIRDQIKNQKEFLLVSLGSFDFKNVEEKMEVFALANPGFVVPKQEEMHGKLKDLQKNTGIFKWIMAVALIAGLAFVLWYFFSQKKSEDTITEKSIAVLPFVNISNDQQQEYFSDGLSEELINLLTKIPELKVIGRTSSFSFKGKNEDLRSIAQKLGVAHLLEGSIRKDGNKIRVTAQLIKATDGSHLWSETYDRDLEDIFKLQDEIAREVVKQLKLKLFVVPSNIALSLTNTEVYNLLLQGNYFLDKRDKVSLAKALKFYRQALVNDSLNARAWAGVANCYSIQASWGWIDRKGFEEAKKAAIKAIELDDKLVEGHRVLGTVKMYDFDWNGADAEYQTSLNLEPENPEVLRIVGILATALGHLDKAIALYKRSLASDPIRPITYLHLGIDTYYANRLDEAIGFFKKALELNPQFPRPHTFLGTIYLLQGKPGMALTEVQQETDETWKGYGISLVYHALGRKKQADEELRNYIATFQKGKAYEIARIYAFRGERDGAFEWLEKAYNNREASFIWFKNDPLLKNLESDSRYIALLKKLNLPLD